MNDKKRLKTAKTPAERKRDQRARERQFDIRVVELRMAASERTQLDENCQLRGGVHGPYSADEYIRTLIRQDNARLKKQLARLRAKGCCGKCGRPLPEGCGGLFRGDNDCLQTRHSRALAL